MEDRFTTDDNNPPEPVKGMATHMKDRIVEHSGQAKEAVAEFGRQAVDTVDARRRPAAGALDQTAAALHQQTDRAAGVAHAAADKLRATADYVREHDMKAMATDVQDLVRRYPVQGLVAAGVLGFVVARVLRSRA